MPRKQRLREAEFLCVDADDLEGVVPERGEVPAAPPSCAARRSSRTDASRRRASTTATSQPAAFSPNVVGTACWRSVRAAIGVER